MNYGDLLSEIDNVSNIYKSMGKYNDYIETFLIKERIKIISNKEEYDNISQIDIFDYKVYLIEHSAIADPIDRLIDIMQKYEIPIYIFLSFSMIVSILLFLFI